MRHEIGGGLVGARRLCTGPVPELRGVGAVRELGAVVRSAVGPQLRGLGGVVH